jgi:transposase-like protein
MSDDTHKNTGGMPSTNPREDRREEVVCPYCRADASMLELQSTGRDVGYFCNSCGREFRDHRVTRVKE